MDERGAVRYNPRMMGQNTPKRRVSNNVQKMPPEFKAKSNTTRAQRKKMAQQAKLRLASIALAAGVAIGAGAPTLISTLAKNFNSAQDSKQAVVIASEFDDYITNIEQYSSAISYSYNLDLQIYKDDIENIVQVNPNNVLEQIGMGNMNMMYMSTNVFTELFDNEEMNKEMYEIVSGKWSEKYNEVVLLVDENNQIMDYTLYALGLKDSTELKEMYKKILNGEEFEVDQSSYNVDDLVGMKFKFLLNSDYYSKENGIWIDKRDNKEFLKEKLKNAEELVETGVIKPSDDTLVSQSTG